LLLRAPTTAHGNPANITKVLQIMGSMTSQAEKPEEKSQLIVRGHLGMTERPWVVTDIDMAEGVPDLPAVNDEGEPVGGAFVLVKVFTEPVAGLWVPFSDVGLQRHELGRIVDAEAGHAVRQRLRLAGWDDASGLPLDGIVATERPDWLVGRDAAESSSVSLTIALCTRDRPEDVRACLASLEEQTYPRLRVLVIDNAPTDDRVRKFVESTDFKVPVQYVLEPTPGLSYARNRAIACCQTEFIAFIDDDEKACRYWASEVIRGFTESPDVACITGAVTPSELKSPAQQLFERYGGHTKGRGFESALFDGKRMGKAASLFPLPPFGVGANMSFRTSALRDLGGFDTALGAGTPSLAGEDTEILSRILLNGGQICYRPAALVRHRHRVTHELLRKQFYGLGVGLTAFYASIASRNPIWVFSLLALAPRALREVFASNGDRAAGLGESYPSDLLAAIRTGMTRGPIAYWKTRIQQRYH
jgi:GT2 family glycosyltransferase